MSIVARQKSNPFLSALCLCLVCFLDSIEFFAFSGRSCINHPLFPIAPIISKDTEAGTILGGQLFLVNYSCALVLCLIIAGND